jgi:hypothetical protein
MVERLKQIWGGFAGATERRLTGRGVDNIAVPHREFARDEASLPERLPAPATAAFDALKSRLAVAKKSGKNEAPAGIDTEAAFGTDAAPARDLVRGLRSTEARLLRSDRLYGDGVPARRGLFSGGNAKKRFIFF